MQIRNSIAELHGGYYKQVILLLRGLHFPAAAKGGAELGQFEPDILAGRDDIELGGKPGVSVPQTTPAPHLIPVSLQLVSSCI